MPKPCHLGRKCTGGVAELQIHVIICRVFREAGGYAKGKEVPEWNLLQKQNIVS